MRTAAKVFLGTAVIVSSIALGWTKAGLRVTYSGSIPVGIYYLTDLPVEHGSIVHICISKKQAALGLRRGYLHASNDCRSGTRPFSKPVVGMPGDTVRLTPDGVFVNGRFLRGSAPRTVDTDGRPLKPAYGEWILQASSYYLYSDYAPAISYDSRYFGPIHGEARVLKPFHLW